MSSSQFSEYQANMENLQKSSCYDGKLLDFGSASTSQLSQVVNSDVVAAWTSCKAECEQKVNAITGVVQYTSNNAATLMMQFDEPGPGAKASILGMSVFGDMSCQCFGAGWASCDEGVNMESKQIYMVYCSRSAQDVASPDALPEAHLTVFTDAGGVFTMSLPQTIEKPLGQQLQDELVAAKNQLALVETSIAELENALQEEKQGIFATLSDLATELEELDTSVAAVSASIPNPKLSCRVSTSSETTQKGYAYDPCYSYETLVSVSAFCENGLTGGSWISNGAVKYSSYTGGCWASVWGHPIALQAVCCKIV
eukprot:scaffold5108_cov29-Prasinocladus_malaysianus.AAC.3